MANTITWFDIPVENLDRAEKFYSFLLDAKLERKQYEGQEFTPFPHEEGEVSGCLYKEESFKPHTGGPLIYFNMEGKIDKVLAELENHGGKIIKKKEKCGEWGYSAVILDTEGNKVALHSYT